MRQLIGQMTGGAESSLARVQHSNTPTILLDMELDGVRCLLIRMQPKPSRAMLMLSPREQEIARMVAEGYPNKTIARVLDISSWTVSTHLRRIFAKLRVRSRAAMVTRIMEEGLMSAQPGQVELLPLRHE